MIRNLTKQTILSAQPRYPNGFRERGRGMIGRKFDTFDAMVFLNCNAIHTCFMSITLDVLFVDTSNKVVRCCESLKPWCFLVYCRNAYAVIELPQGAIRHTKTERNDVLDLCAELAKKKLKELPKRGFINEPGTLIPYGEEKE